jgi:hypothetical protein
MIGGYIMRPGHYLMFRLAGKCWFVWAVAGRDALLDITSFLNCYYYIACLYSIFSDICSEIRLMIR